jgi:hypothetical protein
VPYSSDDAIRAAQALLRRNPPTRGDGARRAALATAAPGPGAAPAAKPHRSAAARVFRFIAIAVAVLIAWNVLCGILVVAAIVGGFFGYAAQHANEHVTALHATAPALAHAVTQAPALPAIAPHGAAAIVTTVVAGIITAIAIPVAFIMFVAWRLWIMLPAIGWRLWTLQWMFGARHRN